MRFAVILLSAACLLAPCPKSASVAGESPVSLDTTMCGSVLTGQEVSEPDENGDRRRKSSDDPCAVADSNLAREEAEILKLRPLEAAAPRKAWDRKSKPEFLDAIRRRFELQPAELAMIGRAGFAVPARLE